MQQEVLKFYLCNIAVVCIKLRNQNSDVLFLIHNNLGVTQERLSEGLTPRHCALSLVGEPIMYPEINSLVDELHRRRISTFLVTNAQFPEKIKMLNPVTQVFQLARSLSFPAEMKLKD